MEISHGSSKPLKKVQGDIEAMESLLTTIASGLTKNSAAADKLKVETAQVSFIIEYNRFLFKWIFISYCASPNLVIFLNTQLKSFLIGPTSIRNGSKKSWSVFKCRI